MRNAACQLTHDLLDLNFRKLLRPMFQSRVFRGLTEQVRNFDAVPDVSQHISGRGCVRGKYRNVSEFEYSLEQIPFQRNIPDAIQLNFLALLCENAFLHDDSALGNLITREAWNPIIERLSLPKHVLVQHLNISLKMDEF